MQFIYIALFSFTLLCSAQIQLIDGSIVNGEIVENNDTFILVQTSYTDNPIKIDKKNIYTTSFEQSFEITTTDIRSDNDIAAYHITKAGQYLKQFQTRYYGGFALGMLGSLMMTVGTFSSANSETGSGGAGIIIIGGVISLAGSIIQLTSFAEAGKAGEELKLAGLALD